MVNENKSDMVRLTVRQAVITEAARLGMPPRVIAEDLGVTRRSITVELVKLRARGIEVPKFKSPGWPKGKPPTGGPGRRKKS